MWSYVYQILVYVINFKNKQEPVKGKTTKEKIKRDNTVFKSLQHKH